MNSSTSVCNGANHPPPTRFCSELRLPRLPAGCGQRHNFSTHSPTHTRAGTQPTAPQQHRFAAEVSIKDSGLLEFMQKHCYCYHSRQLSHLEFTPLCGATHVFACNAHALYSTASRNEATAIPLLVFHSQLFPVSGFLLH